MISRANAVLVLAGSATAFAPTGTPALRKPVSACSSTCSARKGIELPYTVVVNRAAAGSRLPEPQ